MSRRKQIRRKRLSEESPYAGAIAFYIRQDPVAAGVVGPTCPLADADVQEFDLLLARVSGDYVRSLQAGDDEGMDSAEVAMAYLKFVRLAAHDQASWS